MTKRKSDWIVLVVMAGVIYMCFFSPIKDKGPAIMGWIDNGFKNPHRESLRRTFGKEMAEWIEKKYGKMNIYGEIE